MKAVMAAYYSTLANLIGFGIRFYFNPGLHPWRHRYQCAPLDMLFVSVEDGSGGSHERTGRCPGEDYKNW